MGGRAGGGARGGGGRLASAESVFSKAFEDGKFRVGVSHNGNTSRLVATNVKLDGGGTSPVQQFYGSKGAVNKLAQELKSGKTYNQALKTVQSQVW